MIKRAGRVIRDQATRVGIAVLGIFLMGCHFGQGETNGRFSSVEEEQAAARKELVDPQQGNGADIVQVGDMLTVTVSDVPNPPPPFDVKVRDDGKITLLLNKTFVAAGKRTGDLEEEVRKTYVPLLFVNMTVSIRLQNGFYFVGGEVKSPSRYPYLGPTTVLRAIQSAGDFTDFAKKTKVQLTRPGGHKEIVNCVKAQQDPKLDLQVFPGDRIHVPRRIL